MRGLITEGISEIRINEDASIIRLILEQKDKPFYVDIPAENFQMMLPQIIMAVASTQDDGEHAAAIEVAAASVDLDQAGEVLLTLENTGGAHVCYGLSRSVVVELSALLESALQHQSGSTRAH